MDEAMRNKQLVRASIERVWGRQQLAELEREIERFLAPDFVDHGALPGSLPGRDDRHRYGRPPRDPRDRPRGPDRRDHDVARRRRPDRRALDLSRRHRDAPPARPDDVAELGRG